MACVLLGMAVANRRHGAGAVNWLSASENQAGSLSCPSLAVFQGYSTQAFLCPTFLCPTFLCPTFLCPTFLCPTFLCHSSSVFSSPCSAPLRFTSLASCWREPGWDARSALHRIAPMAPAAATSTTQIPTIDNTPSSICTAILPTTMDIRKKPKKPPQNGPDVRMERSIQTTTLDFAWVPTIHLYKCVY
jgi:hypothetical protein